MDPKSNFQPIPSQILRKYIMYTKMNIEPVIGKEAAKVLREFYVKLRQTSTLANGCNPITMRQIESLIRLTQARAKFEMRKVCTENDAKEVVEIMQASMIDHTVIELVKNSHGGAISTDISRSNNKAVKSLIGFTILLDKVFKENGSRFFSKVELKKLLEVLIYYINSYILSLTFGIIK